MKLLSKDVFIPCTAGRPVFPGFASYISADNPVLIHRSGWVDASDTYDEFADRISTDNGRTWSPPVLRQQKRSVEGGTIRYAENAALFDAETNQLITVVCKAFYPNDCPTDEHYEIEFQTYDPSADRWSEPLTTDFGFTEGVAISFPFPIKARSGKILVPACKSRLDKDGNLVRYRGTGDALYEALTIIGQYHRDGTLSWRPGRALGIDPEKSCRGLSENAIAQLSDGRLSMVARGSNAVYPDRLGCKWLSFSEDDGQTWSEVTALPYDDGEPMPSSATGSALFRSIKIKKLYWIGNIAERGEKVTGNWPRSPLIIAEVQEEPFAIRRGTVTVVDRRGPKDSPQTQMSNFRFYQDRENGNIVLFLARYGERDAENWKLADYYRYRIELP